METHDFMRNVGKPRYNIWDRIGTLISKSEGKLWDIDVKNLTACIMRIVLSTQLYLRSFVMFFRLEVTYLRSGGPPGTPCQCGLESPDHRMKSVEGSSVKFNGFGFGFGFGSL